MNSIEQLAEEAKNGDSAALEKLIEGIQNRIYGLAVRMLWHPQDAEDAAQELLVKIVTHLGNFRGECAFTTWCYRIASNHLVTTRKRRAELYGLSFESFEQEIEKGLQYDGTHAFHDAEQDLLAKEVMIGCIQGVMQCLDRNHRIAYILGEVFTVDGNVGAEALDITPEAFRKRLSRARALIKDFVGKHCGLINESSPCACTRQIAYSIKTNLVNPRRLLFVGRSHNSAVDKDKPAGHGNAGKLNKVAELMRRPEYSVPNNLVTRISALIDAGKIPLGQQPH
jgi:RNA polymerase sigma factor (sigma-70 family)